MKKRIRTNAIIIALSFIVIVALPRVFFREKAPGNIEAIRGAGGLLLILLGQFLRVSARGYKSEFSQNSHALITGGPYQLVRNPMYLGIFFIGLGVVIMLFQWWVAALFIVIFSIRYITLIFAEEEKLRKMFPGSYEAYCSRVPRLFPRLYTLCKIKPAAYLPLKPAWFKKEISAIAALLIVSLGLFFVRI